MTGADRGAADRGADCASVHSHITGGARERVRAKLRTWRSVARQLQLQSAPCAGTVFCADRCTPDSGRPMGHRCHPSISVRWRTHFRDTRSFDRQTTDPELSAAYRTRNRLRNKNNRTRTRSTHTHALMCVCVCVM